MNMHRTLVLVALFGAFSAGSAPAQPAAPAKPAAGKAAAPGSERLSDADLEEMLAPIALYPDGLLANVLAAAIYPDEVKAAGDLVAKGATKEQIDAQTWEPPVKAIARVPDALKMMTQYMDWTRALGEAYVVQSQDVMTAVQKLRARAQANGALKTSEQQTVSTQGDTIIVQPANPEVIYVPSYNPVYVYDDDDDEIAAGIIGFGVGIAVGAAIWGCDWHGGCVCWGGGHGDVDIDIDNNYNFNNNNINNDRPRPGQEGGRWQPNRQKMDQNLAAGRPQNLGNYRGGGTAASTGRVPGRPAGSKPIAQNPAPRPSQPRASTGGGAAQRPASAGAAQRPAGSAGAGRGAAASPSARPAPAKPSAMPVNRPVSPNSPSAKPAIPPTRSPSGGGGGGYSGGNRQPTSPAARPSQSSRSSQPSAFNSGGSSRSAASRGGSSRGGGGGGRGGGGRR